MSTTTPSIIRVDRYTVTIDGKRVRATEDQEARLRAMTAEQVAMFVRAMGLDR
jgi:hypothetical protein